VDHGRVARLHDIVFDCAHPAATARFWAAALDDYAVAPDDDAELARLRSLGITSTEDDPTVVVEPAGGGPRLLFQLVPENKTSKNRVHLDVRAAPGLQGDARMEALEAEAVRLVALGATCQTRYEPAPPLDLGRILMTDPEGNEFCVD
jgi:hypothetical protein